MKVLCVFRMLLMYSVRELTEIRVTDTESVHTPRQEHGITTAAAAAADDDDVMIL